MKSKRRRGIGAAAFFVELRLAAGCGRSPGQAEVMKLLGLIHLAAASTWRSDSNDDSRRSPQRPAERRLAMPRVGSDDVRWELRSRGPAVAVAGISGHAPLDAGFAPGTCEGSVEACGRLRLTDNQRCRLQDFHA